MSPIKMTFFVTLLFLSTVYADRPQCEDMFRVPRSIPNANLSRETLQELAKLKVDAEQGPSQEIRAVLSNLFESRLKEIGPELIRVPKVLKLLRTLIAEERSKRSENDREVRTQRQGQEKQLAARKLKILHTFDTDISPSSFGTFNENGIRGSTLNGGRPPDPLYSGAGIKFSRNEQFAMLRSEYVPGQINRTTIVDLKAKKVLKYSPFRGFFSDTSDYFAEIRDDNTIRIVNVRTEKVMGTASGKPLWFNGNTFTNHFIITQGLKKTNSDSYTLNSFKGGTVDLGVAVAAGRNGRILYVKDNKMKCIDGKTLSEVSVPEEFENVQVEPIGGHSEVLRVKIEGDVLNIFPDDFSSYKESEFPFAQLVSYRFVIKEDTTAPSVRTKVYDPKKRKDAEVEGKFYNYIEAAGVLIFHNRNPESTTLLNIKSWTTETFPGIWRDVTQDGAYLVNSGRRTVGTILLSRRDRVERRFEIPGAVKYLPRQGQWIVTLELPNYKGHEQVFAHYPELADSSQVISTNYFFGLSKSGRYLTVGQEGRVRILELDDAVDSD